MSRYDMRKVANDESLGGAENYKQQWTADEVEVLISCWTTEPEGLKTLAEQLGRTVEACRQRYYTHQQGKATTPAQQREERAKREAEERLAQVNTWSKGFTSLDAMGF